MKRRYIGLVTGMGIGYLLTFSSVFVRFSVYDSLGEALWIGLVCGSFTGIPFSILGFGIGALLDNRVNNVSKRTDTFCTACGKPLAGTTRFCGNCGAMVAAPSTAAQTR